MPLWIRGDVELCGFAYFMRCSVGGSSILESSSGKPQKEDECIAPAIKRISFKDMQQLFERDLS